MGSFDSFAQVLEKKIRAQIESEMNSTQSTQSNIRTQIPAETWGNLLGQIQPQRFTQEQKGLNYHRHRKPPPHPAPRPAHKMTAEQLTSFQFFKSHGSDLADNYTLKELKSAYRKLALKIHPDQGGRADLFMTLQQAFAKLQKVLP